MGSAMGLQRRGKMNGGGDKGKGKVKRNVHRRGKGEKGQGGTCKDL